MKKRLLIVGIVIVLVAAAIIALVLLLPDGDNLQYDSKTRTYVRNKDGATYRLASANYRAICLDKDREICQIEHEDGENTVLYEICNNLTMNYMSSALWMGDEEYRVYYADGIILPKLWEMQADDLYLFESRGKLYQVGLVEEDVDVAKIVNLYETGDAFKASDTHSSFGREEVQTSYEIGFTTKGYEGLYYMLAYRSYEDAICYREETTGISEEDYVPAYDFSYEWTTFVTDEGEVKTYAEYDLGTDFLYDPVTGLCYPLGDLADILIDKT